MVFTYLFPDRCVGCNRLGTLLCPDCLIRIPAQLSPLCPGCLQSAPGRGPHPACRRKSTPDYLFVPFRYQGIVRRAVKLAKFRRDQRLMGLMGTLLVEEIEEVPELFQFLTGYQPLVVPVPLGKRRLKERGFNQAARLGQSLARRWRLRLVENGLVRSIETLPQARLAGAARKRNLINSFGARKDVLVGKKRVVLVDDVVTTGATLHACSLALRKVGVSDVWAVVLAH